MIDIRTFSIANGEVLSAAVDLKNARCATLFVPTITSGDLFVRAASDSTSGTSSRLQNINLPGSADLRLAAGAGGVSFALREDIISCAPFLRLESSVAQGAERVFTLTVKFT